MDNRDAENKEPDMFAPTEEGVSYAIEKKEFSFEDSEERKQEEIEMTKEITKNRGESQFLSKEERKVFVLDESVGRELRGVLENRIDETRLEAFKKHMKENADSFGKKRENIERMSDLQVKHIMESRADEVTNIASKNPRYSEAVHLADILNKSRENLTYDEKLMFFKRIDSGIVDDPELLKKLQRGLWNAKEGEKISEKAIEKVEELKQKKEHDEYVREELNNYKFEELSQAIGITEDEIKEKRNENEEANLLSDNEIRAIIIEEKKEKIKKNTGLEWSDEEIIALANKGCRLSKFSPQKIFGINFSKKIKIEENKVPLEKAKEIAKREEGEIIEDFNKKLLEIQKEWEDFKIEEVKDTIIKESMDEIPEESAKRIYEKYKSRKLANFYLKREIKKDEKLRKKFKGEFGDKSKNLADVVEELAVDGIGGNDYGEGDFKRILSRLESESLEDYIKKNLGETAKNKGENQRYFWLAKLFEFMFSYLSEVSSQEKKEVKK